MQTTKAYVTIGKHHYCLTAIEKSIGQFAYDVFDRDFQKHLWGAEGINSLESAKADAESKLRTHVEKYIKPDENGAKEEWPKDLKIKWE